MSITSPFELLSKLDSRFRRNSSGLPVAKAVITDWIGIGFSINELPLLAKMDDVSEILPTTDDSSTGGNPLGKWVG
jgi:hypothetical protein